MAKRKGYQPRIETAIHFSYPTSDDWSPNFPRNTVQVSVYAYYDIQWVKRNREQTDGMIRIVVRGADDRAMEKDTYLNVADYPTKLEEIRKWCEHSLPNPLTMDWLRTQGFNFS